jgi:hypothetical protein
MGHVKNYLQWLESNMTEQIIEPGVTEITTPFLDRHNDYTQIYVIEQNNKMFKISDDSYTVGDLLMSGVDINSSSKRKAIFQQILDRQAVDYDAITEELFIECTYDDIPTAQHRLLQCMLDVNDMFYLASSTVKQLFFEEVISFFEDHEIYFSEDMALIGKSGFTHTFDLHFQRNKNRPERFAKVINAPNKSEMERCIFAWTDIKDSKKASSELVVILNDKRAVDAAIIKGFESYEIKPYLWSQRNSFMTHFN